MGGHGKLEVDSIGLGKLNNGRTWGRRRLNLKCKCQVNAGKLDNNKLRKWEMDESREVKWDKG
jgi:hypothetical protein